MTSTSCVTLLLLANEYAKNMTVTVNKGFECYYVLKRLVSLSWTIGLLLHTYMYTTLVKQVNIMLET